MTSNSDPGGYSGLKFCIHASLMGQYRYTNFDQNRRGSGTAVSDLTWNWTFSTGNVLMVRSGQARPGQVRPGHSFIDDISMLTCSLLLNPKSLIFVFIFLVKKTNTNDFDFVLSLGFLGCNHFP